MSMAEALGILETTGLTGIIAGGDAMAKAAKVDLSGWDRVGSGMATIFCRGDVASVSRRWPPDRRRHRRWWRYVRCT